MTVVSCDDEPPEPLIEDIANNFNTVTLFNCGVVLSVPVRHLPTVRSFRASPKNRKREFRALRSYVWVATLLDNRCALQCFASVWKSSVRSLTYKPPCWEIPAAESIAVDFQPDCVVSTSHRVATVPPALPEPVVTQTTLDDHKINISAEKEHLCLPSIVITPPLPTDIDWTWHNTVPTPQNAARGNLLTVPDPDCAISNRRGQGSTFSNRGYLAVSRHAWKSLPRNNDSKVAKRTQPVTCTPIRRSSFVEMEDDEEVDLGPTWSG